LMRSAAPNKKKGKRAATHSLLPSREGKRKSPLLPKWVRGKRRKIFRFKWGRKKKGMPN